MTRMQNLLKKAFNNNTLFYLATVFAPLSLLFVCRTGLYKLFKSFANAFIIQSEYS